MCKYRLYDTVYKTFGGLNVKTRSCTGTDFVHNESMAQKSLFISHFRTRKACMYVYTSSRIMRMYVCRVNLVMKQEFQILKCVYNLPPPYATSSTNIRSSLHQQSHLPLSATSSLDQP